MGAMIEQYVSKYMCKQHSTKRKVAIC